MAITNQVIAVEARHGKVLSTVAIAVAADTVAKTYGAEIVCDLSHSLQAVSIRIIVCEAKHGVAMPP